MLEIFYKYATIYTNKTSIFQFWICWSVVVSTILIIRVLTETEVIWYQVWRIDRWSSVDQGTNQRHTDHCLYTGEVGYHYSERRREDLYTASPTYDICKYIPSTLRFDIYAENIVLVEQNLSTYSCKMYDFVQCNLTYSQSLKGVGKKVLL